jgi:hypothetical protein
MAMIFVGYSQHCRLAAPISNAPSQHPLHTELTLALRELLDKPSLRAKIPDNSSPLALGSVLVAT